MSALFDFERIVAVERLEQERLKYEIFKRKAREDFEAWKARQPEDDRRPAAPPPATPLTTDPEEVARICEYAESIRGQGPMTPPLPFFMRKVRITTTYPYPIGPLPLSHRSNFARRIRSRVEALLQEAGWRADHPFFDDLKMEQCHSSPWNDVPVLTKEHTYVLQFLYDRPSDAPTVNLFEYLPHNPLHRLPGGRHAHETMHSCVLFENGPTVAVPINHFANSPPNVLKPVSLETRIARKCIV